MKLDEKQVRAALDRIERLIADQGMSKTEFYDVSGISSALFSQWNTGKYNPTEKSLWKAAGALGTTTEYLLTGEEQKKEAPSPESGIGLLSDYDRLTPDNRSVVDALIAALLKSQSGN